MPTNSTILEPHLACQQKIGETATVSSTTNNTIECSVHTLPKPLLREFRHVFGEKYLPNDDVGNGDGTNNESAGGNTMSDENVELLAIPTNQHALQDLVAVGEEVEKEKDRLLNVFLAFGEEFCKKVRDLGYWADYIDPCSGLPMVTRDCNKVYSEVDGMECLLHYKAHNAGFCKVLTHPKWGSAVYPATMFAYAPRDVIVNLVKEYHVAER